MTIQQLLDFIFETERITNKEELGKYTGLRKNGNIKFAKLYKYCEKFANDHWIRLAVPQSAVRAYTETKITGYKICK